VMAVSRRPGLLKMNYLKKALLFTL